MEAHHQLLRLPRLPSTEDVNSFYQSLRDRLVAELQRLVTSIIEAQTPHPDPSRCSCRQPGHCRIILVTVTDRDHEPYLEPAFISCSCGPVSHAHHQRQLELITFDLKDKEHGIRQLRMLEDGIRSLLVRHREISKAEIRQAQYWLRQDYARTNMIRELYNEEIQRQNRNATKVSLSKLLGQNGETSEDGHPKPVKVEKEDLWIDDEEYEHFGSLLDRSLFKRGSSTDDRQTPVKNSERGSFSNTAEELLTNNVFSRALIRSQSESQPKNPTSPNKLRLGPIIDIDEVFSRFDDIKAKAAEYMSDWDDEDILRADNFIALYPRLHGKCCCTFEHRLYHAFQDAAFLPSQQMSIEANLKFEMRRSDLRKDLQEQMTTERQGEVGLLLQAIENHIPAQVSDIRSAVGVAGRTKALVAYLKKYGRDDFQDSEVGVWVSTALTLDLLRKVDAMLERWGDEDAGMEKRIKEILQGE
ncbi:MAG: hypothetical protein Q9170_000008 [Blastenia crenularia]